MTRSPHTFHTLADVPPAETTSPAVRSLSPVSPQREASADSLAVEAPYSGSRRSSEDFQHLPPFNLAVGRRGSRHLLLHGHHGEHGHHGGHHVHHAASEHEIDDIKEKEDEGAT